MATFVKPIVVKTCSNRPFSGAVNSTNSKPSSPIGFSNKSVTADLLILDTARNLPGVFSLLPGTGGVPEKLEQYSEYGQNTRLIVKSILVVVATNIERSIGVCQ